MVYRAHKYLKAEMAAQGLEVPAWGTMWKWAKEHEDVISRIDAHEKRDMDRLASEVSLASAEKMLTAIEEDEKVSHAQRAMDYGISMDKVIGLAKVGQAGTVQAVQVNIIDSKGEKIDQV